MIHGGYNASCVPPPAYGNRFIDFMKEIIKSNLNEKKSALKQDKTKAIKGKGNSIWSI